MNNRLIQLSFKSKRPVVTTTTTTTIAVTSTTTTTKATTTTTTAAPAPNLAFSTVTGFAKGTRGAYAKYIQSGNSADLPVVKFVDNTNDTGANSLREALTTTVPRIVIFRTGGTITLNSAIVIKNPYITIAGWTAPGSGICIKNAPIIIQTSEVIIRNLRFRHGVYAPPDYGEDNISISANGTKLRNIVIDHCSLTWASDEQIGMSGTNGGVENVSVQNCIAGEGFVGHAFALLANGNSSNPNGNIANVSVHRNLFISVEGRCPRLGQWATGTVINNLTHNWASQASQYADGTKGDVLYNKFKPGSNTTTSGKNKAIQVLTDGTAKSTMHISGNINSGGIVLAYHPDSSAGSNLSATPHYNNQIYGFTPETDTNTLETELLSVVGAYPRDSVDARLVSNYTNANGTIPTENTTLIYPVYNAGTYKANNTGVHLDWLVAKGYANSTSAAQALTSQYLISPSNGSGGYSIIELFINDVNYFRG